MEFVDIAGIVRGASEGEGLGNKFLSHIRESAAICQVTRVFRDEDVTHVDGEVNPESDLATIQTELILADLQTLEKAIPRLEKEARGNKALAANLDAAREALGGARGRDAGHRTSIDRARCSASCRCSPPSRSSTSSTATPTSSPTTTSRSGCRTSSRRPRRSSSTPSSRPSWSSSTTTRRPTRCSPRWASRSPGLDLLARVGFDTLGLQTYLTAGPKETRAWTIRKGATAPEAAGVIHTDFQRGFIKAEIVSYDDLMAAGSMLKAKEAGRVRMEGKDYVMHDGDVVEFRFNV